MAMPRWLTCLIRTRHVVAGFGFVPCVHCRGELITQNVHLRISFSAQQHMLNEPENFGWFNIFTIRAYLVASVLYILS